MRLKLGAAESEQSRLRDGARMKRGEAGLGVSTGVGDNLYIAAPLISRNLWGE